MKTNSRFLFVAALTLALAFTFSCSSDNNDGNDGGGNNSALVGKWYDSQEQADEVGAAAAEGKLYSVSEYTKLAQDDKLPQGAVVDVPMYEFKSNGQLLIAGQSSAMGISFTYEATADKIRATGDWVDYTISGNELTIANGGSGLTPGTYYKPGKGGGSNNGWTSVTNSPFGTNKVRAIVYGNNKFVAVGSNGKMATSTDGVTWTAVTNGPFGTSDIDAIAFGNGTFIAGTSYKMATSTDGITWTAVADSKFSAGSIYGGSGSIYAIAYGNGKFVAGGRDIFGTGMTYSSDNGVTWTAATADGEYDFGYSIESIAYGSGKFVSGSSDGKMTYSSDGATWTAVDIGNIFKNSSYGVNINAIVFGNGKFVAVGDDGKIATSTDGVTWTAVTSSPFGTSDIDAIAYGNNKFFAGSSGKMAYSTNGTSWTAVSYNPFGTGGSTAIAYGNGKFVAGSNDGRIAYSTGN
jgi:hypothetical protein